MKKVLIWDLNYVLKTLEVLLDIYTILENTFEASN